uniref:Uncharacterized protein n=1 Tax=Rhizophora mucronata TaxID=61149 RepID=A0A2P2QW69_RHIMU
MFVQGNLHKQVAETRSLLHAASCCLLACI